MPTAAAAHAGAALTLLASAAETVVLAATL